MERVESVETLWLTIGTLGFAAATIYFLSLMNGAPEGSRYFFIITAAITGVAAFFYLTMSTGATSSLIEGRNLDWVITTLLLLTNRKTLSDAVGGARVR